LALSKRGAAALTAALSVAVCLMAAGPALGADQRLVKIQDDCDPATFNAVIGPGTCVGDGRTTFADFLDEFLAQGSVDRWAFSRPEFNIDAGGTVSLVNQGGETHTFTKVPAFGNGCVGLLNDPPTQPPEPPVNPAVPCDTIVPIPAGESTAVDPEDLEPGVNLFQCMIHPWMQAVVDVRVKNRGGRG
jgi:plastocyanin